MKYALLTLMCGVTFGNSLPPTPENSLPPTWELFQVSYSTITRSSM